MTKTTAERAVPPQVESVGRRGLWFAVLSAPLLLGLFVPGLPVLAFLTVPLAMALGPRVWPGVGPGVRLVSSLVAVLVVWVVPAYLAMTAGVGLGVAPASWFDGIALLVLPLCETDAGFVLLPAAAATTAYALLGWASVGFRNPRLWPLAALVVPLVHALALWFVVESGLGRVVSCI